MKIWVYRFKDVEQGGWKVIHLGEIEIIGEGKIEEMDREYSLFLPSQKKLLINSGLETM